MDMLITFLALDWRGLARWPIERVRADLAARPLPTSATKLVRVERVDAGGVPGAWIESDTAKRDRVVLYLHGGSYLFGSHETHADTLARIALASGARVLAPDYRLAPEHPYPAQLDDALRVYRYLLEKHAPEQIVVAGESAGGNLTLTLLIALRERGLPMPAGAAPISAWVDLGATRQSHSTNAAGDYGDREMLLEQARMFANDIPLDDPRISPLFADLRGLPPLYLQFGALERLRDENLELADKVRKAGGAAEVDSIANHPHAPLFFAHWSPEAQAGVDRLGRWIRGRFGG
ncbi:MAG: alpha/beta hydrolase [Polyangiaceae bacterium]|nr:alpha/beta hydrolase [Polyangiaceae bacterium]